MNSDALLGLSRNLLSPLSARTHPDHAFTSEAAAGLLDAQIPGAVAIERDINYADSGDRAQTLDVLTPTSHNSDRPLPVIVSIHGGGFITGDKSSRLADLIPFVESGDFVGVTANYRFSDEALWPAQIRDCKAAIRWVRANAVRYNIDPDRIGVIGESAGGNLVAMLRVTDRIKALDGDIGLHTNFSGKVRCVVAPRLPLREFSGRASARRLNAIPNRPGHPGFTNHVRVERRGDVSAGPSPPRPGDSAYPIKTHVQRPERFGGGGISHVDRPGRARPIRQPGAQRLYSSVLRETTAR